MLETTRIRREGFSYRPTFAEFMERFGLLAFSPTAKVTASTATCERVMKVSGLQGWLMGKTKVFLKYWHVEQLDKQLRVFQNNAVVLQQIARGFLARRYDSVYVLYLSNVYQSHVFDYLPFYLLLSFFLSLIVVFICIYLSSLPF